MADGVDSLIEVTVGDDDDGMRLDAWLAGAIADVVAEPCQGADCGRVGRDRRNDDRSRKGRSNRGEGDAGRAAAGPGRARGEEIPLDRRLRGRRADRHRQAGRAGRPSRAPATGPARWSTR